MRQTKAVQVKHLQIGGGAPVVIQSMTKTDTSDVGATVAQIEEMVRAGCEVVRLAVPDNDAAVALKEIRKRFESISSSSKIIVTTEKDAVRLVKFDSELTGLPLFVIPIRHDFLFGEQQSFDQSVQDFIRNFK